MRTEKIQLVNYIGDLLKNSSFLYFVSYKGLTVKEFSELRNRLAEKSAVCQVLKNSLIKKAAELSELGNLAKAELTESTAMISGAGDPGAVAKIISEFNKQHEKMAPKGGYLDGALLKAEEVRQIASLPAKEVLQAQLLGVLQAPSRNLVSLLNAKAATILNVLSAYQKKREDNQ